MVNIYRLIASFLLLVSFSAFADFSRPAVYYFNGRQYPTAQAACKAYDPNYDTPAGVGAIASPERSVRTDICITAVNSFFPAVIESVCEDVTGRQRLNRTPAPVSFHGVSLGTDTCNYAGADPSGPGTQDECKGLADWCANKQRLGLTQLFRAAGQSAEWACIQAAEPYYGDISGFEPAFPGCKSGCLLSTGTTVAAKDDDGKWWTQGTGKYVGSVCNPDVINKLNEGTPEEKEIIPPDSKPPGKCNGQPGTVNGVEVCVPFSEAKGDGSTKVETNSDGSKKETKTETTCTGSKCTTTTTTTNKDGNGNTINTSVVITNTTKDDYCARNSGSSVCKVLESGKGNGDSESDKSSFGGNCSAGWSCEGDAIQCAVAREQHKRACQLFEDRDNDAYRLYDSEKNKEGSVLSGLKGNKDIDISQYVNDRDDFIGSGSCPADRVIPFRYGEVSIPYSRLCPYLEMLGTVLIICAGIAGARIITRRDS